MVVKPKLEELPGVFIKNVNSCALLSYRVSLMAQLVKNLPAVRETWIRSLSWEGPLEKGTATHSSIWPGKFHGLDSPWGRKESDTTEQLSLLLFSPAPQSSHEV